MKTKPEQANSSPLNATAKKSETLEMSSHDFETEMGMHPARRPMNIEKDVSSLGQKKRVSSILRSPDFKEELETVVTDLLRSDKGGGRVIAQAIANVFSPSGRPAQQGIGCVSPINDLTGADTSLYSKGEKLLRCKLAALYRVVDLYGWTAAIYNHITLRVSQEQEHFLINPFGLLYHEVSASKLIKVNMQGDVIDGGSSTLGFNQAGYTLHSAIHAARPDIHCVIHVHTSDVVAVSCMECGFLPISQEALIVGEVSYHSYHGILVDNKEKKAIQKHLGPNNKVMILRNHGLVACGATVEEAFHYLYFAMAACSTQVKAMSCSKIEKLIQLDRAALKSRTEEMGRKDVTVGKEGGVKWGVGEMMFEALVRMLDDMGYRSGYSYRNPVVVQHKPRVKSDVELPPTAVGHTAVLQEDLEDVRGSLRTNEQSRWVNSPNHYTRIDEEGEEEAASGASSQNGDGSPRSRAKWRRNEATSSAVRTNPNQFVPTNTDPREVLETRKSIRGQGRWDQHRPGPQSQLLHSVSPENTASMPPFDDVALSFCFDDVAGELYNPFTAQVVATSSKAIIAKGTEVSLVPPAGPPNPFNVMKEEDRGQEGSQAERDDANGHSSAADDKNGYSPAADDANGLSPTAGDAIKEAEERPAEEAPAANTNDNHKAAERGGGEAAEDRPPVEAREGHVASPGGSESKKKKKKRPLSFSFKKKK